MSETRSSIGSFSSAGRRWAWWDIALLMLALAVALFLRVTHVDPTPSFDELWHLRLSAGKGLPLGMYEPDKLYLNPWHPTSLEGAPPLWRVWTSMDGVLHPPLYVTTLRVWRDVFGEGNRVANAYSILWGIVSIAFVFAAARLAMGRLVAFAVAIALATSTTQIYFAQEIRAYAMLGALSSICLWLMTRIEVLGPTRRRAAALAAMTLPMLLTHYFAFGAALGVTAYGAWRLSGHRRTFALTLAAAALVYGIIWIPFALQQVNDLGAGDVSWKVAHRDLWRDLRLVLNAPFRLVVDRRYSTDPLSLIAGVLFVLPWLLVRRLGSLAPWTAILFGTIWGLLVLDLIRSTEVVGVTRYIAVAGPAVFLAFAGCGSAIDRRLGVAMAASLALMGAINLYAGIGVDIDVQSFGDVTGELAKRAKPGDTIVAYGGFQNIFYADAVLMTCSNATNVPRGPYLNMTRPMSREQESQIGPTVWLVCSWAQPPATELVPGSRIVWQTILNGNGYLYQLALDNGSATDNGSDSGPSTGSAERLTDNEPGR